MKKQQSDENNEALKRKVLQSNVARQERGMLGDQPFGDGTYVRTTHICKPDIPDDILVKWQKIADLMAEILGVPTGLIMKVDPPQIEVFIASSAKGNPYKKGERADLNTGLYCETVMSQRSRLLVPNALKDPDWNHNPDVKLGMISYLGFPVCWPDGGIFGTICVLDVKENHYNKVYIELLAQFKELIDNDLKLLCQRYELEEDITQRKRAEQSLLAAEEELKHTIEVVPGIIAKANAQTGYITHCNPALTSILGFSSEEFLARPFIEFIHPDDRQSTINEVEKQLKGSPVARFENRYICKDGSYKWLEWRATAADENGVVYAAATDITVRKQKEDDLYKEKNLLAVVMENTGVKLVYLDNDFNFIRVNDAYARTCGYTPEEMIGKNHFNLYPHKVNQAIFTRVRDTGQPETYYSKPFTFPDQPKRGVTYWDWTLSPTKDTQGNVSGLIFSLVETTEHVMLEEQRQKAAKFEAEQELHKVRKNERVSIIRELHDVTQALINNITEEPVRTYNITNREREVLALMVSGLSNNDIAEQLTLSQATVKFHVSNIISKLEVPNRTGAVALAIKEKLIA